MLRYSDVGFNLLKPSGFFKYHQVQNKKILHGVRFALCFVLISEQTATFVLYVINWLVSIDVVESVYSAVRTNTLYKADCVSSLNNRGGKCLQRGTDLFLI